MKPTKMKGSKILVIFFLFITSFGLTFFLYPRILSSKDFSQWSDVCISWVKPVTVGYTKQFWPWSPDGKWIVYNNYPPTEHMPGQKPYQSTEVEGIYLVKYDGTEKRFVVANGRRPVFGRSQEKIIYSRDGASGKPSPKVGLEEDIWMIDADGKNEIQLTSGPQDDKMKVWGTTPLTYDGQQVLYFIAGTGIGIVNSDGTNPLVLIDHSGHAAGYSPDGKKVFTTGPCVVSPKGKLDESWLCGGFVSLDRSGKKEWLTKMKAPNDYWHLMMNLDATMITFDNPRWTDRNIWVAKLDGSNEHLQLTDYHGELGSKGVWGNHPRFSPDGRWVVYDEQSVTEGGIKDKVMIVNVETREKKEIYGLVVPGHCGWTEPGWSPDGKKIIFYAPDPNNGNLPSIWVALLEECGE